MVKRKKKLIGLARDIVGTSMFIGMGSGVLQKAGYSQVGMSELSGWVGTVTHVTMGKHLIGIIKKRKRRRRS